MTLKICKSFLAKGAFIELAFEFLCQIMDLRSGLSNSVFFPDQTEIFKITLLFSFTDFYE